ncbi:LOW QUALITY PROTEIN: uncharacterized protein LOC110228594 [Arabidopsis lyrata subsp. lyrata]|nr:LOW QUALITY PROTEIN: uncharacterized protein LOC110228594 [Arabidopsis lyrata subsp. lyrata]|eukprot:XP_020881983.1 LOW QUALITY PROTEIN: uncharacterized protein LOC110228594 [Arabidopsis lyrata subsp. lyrata]
MDLDRWILFVMEICVCRARGYRLRLINTSPFDRFRIMGLGLVFLFV